MGVPTPAAFHHTAFLVRDLEGSARRLSQALGIEEWNIWTITPTHCVVRGKETPFSFRVALASVGPGTFELITPHTGQTVYDEHLAEHGEGFHHTCMVYSSIEAVRAAKADLVRQGRELVQDGHAGDIFDFSYFHFPELGSMVELLYLDASRLPPPEAVVRRTPA